MAFRFSCRALTWGVLAAWVASPVAADGTLIGRLVTMNVETYDVDGAPIFISKGRTVRVGNSVEFDLLPENGFNGLDVVPVRIEITNDRIEFSYGKQQGSFFQPARFNGYVLRFEAECGLFESARVDAGSNTIELTDDRISTQNGALFVDVKGLTFGPNAAFGVDVRVSDCLLG